MISFLLSNDALESHPLTFIDNTIVLSRIYMLMTCSKPGEVTNHQILY